MDVSVIILSYNTSSLLRNCLRSVINNTFGIDYEITVVDNASTDGSVEMIESEFKEIKLIKNTENQGFSKANNQAIKIARGKYILLLNSDTLTQKNIIESMVKFIEAHEDAAAIGPKVLNADGTLQNMGVHFPTIHGELLLLFRIYKFFPWRTRNRLFHKYFRDENTISQVDWISGCCLLIRRKALEEIGLLSEEFFFYGEEIEWCYRAQRLGYRIYYWKSVV